MLIFFLKAKAGMGDVAVTGVQTCALPISRSPPVASLSRCPPKSPRAVRRYGAATLDRNYGFRPVANRRAAEGERSWQRRGPVGSQDRFPAISRSFEAKVPHR